jgi:transposase
MSTLQQRAVGIDVGADNLHIALSHERTAPVYRIDLVDPLWHIRLAEFISSGDVVALEPTGWHYAAPVIAALAHIGACILIVEHRVTGQIRDLKIAGVKNDKTDARALHYIAHHHQQEPFYGVNSVHPTLQASAMGLRMMIHAYMRSDKERTRTLNRIRQMTHSVAPILNIEIKTYLHAVGAGYSDLDAVRDLAAELARIDGVERRRDRVYPEGYKTEGKRAALYDLVEQLPVWSGNRVLTDVIADEYAAWRDIDARKDRLEAAIGAIAAREPFGDLTSLWMSVPGVGLTLCAMLHAATRGLASYLTPEQFRASLGSHPRISSSGKSAESIAAAGGFRPAKKLLHLAEMYLIRVGDNPVADTFAYHKARGEKYAMQKARAKLVNILSGVARTGTPYDPALHVERYSGTGGR